MPSNETENVLVGVETKDDACVFLLPNGEALVQTVDFFTPIVNDPYLFGQIAAANALSDIYAMGAEPSHALSLIAFPCSIGMDVLLEIVRGGNNKMSEAGATILGGHSVDDDEPKYGFCVVGFSKPENIIRNSTARSGDFLYLTKPLGTGVIATAIKGELITEEDVYEQLEQVIRLNKKAKDAAVASGATALTDVTGFGLVGHAHEMAMGAGISIELFTGNIPVFEKALEFISMGIIPLGLHENKSYMKDMLEVAGEIDSDLMDVLFDPQTSGGLLIAVPEDRVSLLEKELKNRGEIIAQVGRFKDGKAGTVRLIP